MTERVPVVLPESLTVFERGWLSSNNVLVLGREACALVDSGYALHAPQTLALLEASLQGRALDLLVNTHLHSDHCGGNALLQQRYPALCTLIPPGHSAEVARWDEDALTYRATGQICPRFGFSDTLRPGSELRLGDDLWQVHAAPGHDTHSVILFEPRTRTLISADALWERGFGVVFPELDGEDAFDEVSATLDVIEALQPSAVIPGHGSPFADVAAALAVARQRLDGFARNPQKHLQYAAKVLLKFKLLEQQAIARESLLDWAARTPYFASIMVRHPQSAAPLLEVLDALLQDLVRSGAARVEGGLVYNQ